MNSEKVLPIWQRTTQDYIRTEHILNISGYIHDTYLSFDQSGYSTLTEYLNDLLQENGFDDVLGFHPCTGFENDPVRRENTSVSKSVSSGKARSIGLLADRIEKEFSDAERKKAIIVSDASFLCASNTHLTNEEHDAWVKIRNAMYHCSPENRLIMLFENDSDIPRALEQASGLSKNLIVSRPDQTQRKQFVSLVLPHLSEEEQEYIADISSDLGLKKLTDILAEVHRTDPKPDKQALSKAIKKYIYGYADNPWQRIPKKKIMQLEQDLNQQIKGQQTAISSMAKKIRAAWAGTKNVMDGNNAPAGVAVNSGPTGVGKTLMAKLLAKYIMGDSELLIRINGNQYTEEHQTQCLIGSPPGYVGYEQGGQLTNAVNERPFSIILIDEIEKAHPRFWDYFMQVLEEGKLTDGRGNVCVFKNTFLIFTTNLGAKEASACEDPAKARDAICDAIERYFISINRMEIFGRLRPHIIPFNSMTDSVACEIIEAHLKNISSNYRAEQKVSVLFSDTVIEKLKTATGISSEYGARDIKNTVNELLLNPLSEIKIDNEIGAGTVIDVSDIVFTEDEENPVNLIYSVDNTRLESALTIPPVREKATERRPLSDGSMKGSERRSVTAGILESDARKVITVRHRR